MSARGLSASSKLSTALRNSSSLTLEPRENDFAAASGVQRACLLLVMAPRNEHVAPTRWDGKRPTDYAISSFPCPCAEVSFLQQAEAFGR